MTLKVQTQQIRERRPLLDLIPPDTNAVAWVTAGEGLVGWGIAEQIDAGTGKKRYSVAEEALAELAASASIEDDVERAGTGPVGFGSYTFDEAAPGTVLIVPRVIVGRRNGTTWLTTIDPTGAQPVPGPAAGPPVRVRSDRPRYAGATSPDLHWLEAVSEAIERIRAHEIDKVVLARDYALWSREPFDTIDVARRLATRFHDCHTFAIDGLVGATPETLVRRIGAMVSSRVLAGTAARDTDPDRDAALGSALLRSDKDRREHQLAVDSVVDVLAHRCVEHQVDEEPSLLVLDNVQHLATSFTGQLSAGESSLTLAGALHPTAAVGGTPRESALEVIRELEGMDRYRYAAPVGWTDAKGDGEWGIALRCAHIEGARARLFAGVGIVEGSLPEEELNETRLKLLAMQAVLDTQLDA